MNAWGRALIAVHVVLLLGGLLVIWLWQYKIDDVLKFVDDWNAGAVFLAWWIANAVRAVAVQLLERRRKKKIDALFRETIGRMA